MARRPLVIVSAILALALTILVVIGMRVLARDRAELFARYGETREHAIEEVARGVAGEVTDISDDLDLAAILYASAENEQLAERELHAIATIKREYLAMYARTDGATTKVTAYDAPVGIMPVVDAPLEAVLQRAEKEPGKLHASTAFAEPGTLATWYRVFARKKDNGPAVAVAVDTAVLLSRMKLQSDALTRVAVLDAGGQRAAASDPRLAELTHVAGFAKLVRQARADSTARVVDADVARAIGLPASEAVIAAVPLAVDGGPPWTLVIAASTQSLQAQQRTILHRVLLGSVLVLVLLASAAAYVLHNTFRARSLRERLEAASRLAHLTEKAEKILDHIPSGVLALSEDLRVTGQNRWLAERVKHDLVGRTLASAFDGAPSQDVAVVVTLVKRALETREPQTLHREHVALLGQDAALNIHAVPLARGVGDVSVLLVLEDLSELRRIEQRLLHSEKLVTAGQLAAGIAHEIGTPLNVARGRVELVLSHLGGTHAEADNHRLVIDQIDRVTRLIQQLLDYVRPAPGAVQHVDLAQSLRAVKELLSAQAAKRRVTLAVDAEVAAVRTDPDQIQQIVVNLTLNAIDACAQGGTVALRVKRREGAVVLEIEDTGHGISPELQKQVFDPFFTTKKRGQGTGLGLWVVAQLVRAQSAEIELHSVPGSGTTVRVAWPVAA
jgi:signal transduction histidine kinase